MLELRNITKVYNPGTVQETVLFRDFSLTVADGSFVSVVGSNGSGKTTYAEHSMRLHTRSRAEGYSWMART